MTCPDWNRLVARRDGADEPETEWLAAVEHLDACPRCERTALAADPALVFRRLGPLELDPAAEKAEVESVRRAVAAMRTGRRLERFSQAGAHARHWRRYAAAAVLAAAALSLGVDRREDGPGRLASGAAAARGALGSLGSKTAGVLSGEPSQPSATAGSTGAIVPASVVTPAVPPPYSTYGEADGAMEGLNRPKARVYQLHGRHLQVVMIVDEKLDV
jgi:hypothetical protein